METLDPTDSESLTREDLRHLQRSLQRRAARRDGANIWAVGFGAKVVGGQPQSGLAARFVVRHKRANVSAAKRIPPIERVRLLDRSAGRYRSLTLPTDVVAGNRPRPVGVRVRQGDRMATTAAVLRWTTRRPPPPTPTVDDPDDPRWRWGLLTVAHLFAARRSGTGAGRSDPPRIDRVTVCGQGPKSIEGSLAAVGRLPGGPDAAVIETGLDRLWLSGFLPEPAAAPTRIAEDRDLLRWIREGVRGYVHGAGRVIPWQFAIYLPEQTIPGLGRLRDVVQFRAEPAHGTPAPFGPGSSGGVLVAAGAPLGIQVAAESPAYTTGYAQGFTAIMPWLSSSLGASRVVLVRVV